MFLLLSAGVSSPPLAHNGAAIFWARAPQSPFGELSLCHPQSISPEAVTSSDSGTGNETFACILRKRIPLVAKGTELSLEMLRPTFLSPMEPPCEGSPCKGEPMQLRDKT